MVRRGRREKKVGNCERLGGKRERVDRTTKASVKGKKSRTVKREVGHERGQKQKKK